MSQKILSTDKSDRRELRVAGRVVSRGTGIGIAVKLEPSERRLSKRQLNPFDVEAEVLRLDVAVKLASLQLNVLIGQRSDGNLISSSEIFDAQLLILLESSLTSKIQNRIKQEFINAEWAAKLTADDYFDQFQALDDEILRERSADIQDVFDRIFLALSPESEQQTIPYNSVVVAKEIRPSTMLKLAESRPVAIVVESGGWTSHAFIMARELGIPAISGIRNAVHRISNGTLVAVDAVEGVVIVDPNEHSSSTFLAGSEDSFDASPTALKYGVATTINGTAISIAANVDNDATCRHAIELGALEIGLVRSEYLFDVTTRLPDESVQTAQYAHLAEMVGECIIRIRTFDMSVGQLTSSRGEPEANPALGLRSIRLSLRYERQFRAQIRALIRANSRGNVEVVLPLVSGVNDIVRTRSILDEEFAKLSKSIEGPKLPKLGAMIEVPSAVLTINEILEHVDFVCIGTNDLVQYLLGVDRDNETVADWYETLHPSVIRSIAMVVDAAKLAAKPLTVCGEMAGSAFYIPLLVGLGVRRLSMSPVSMDSVANQVSVIDIDKAESFVKSISGIQTASEIGSAILEFNKSLSPASHT